MKVFHIRSRSVQKPIIHARWCQSCKDLLGDWILSNDSRSLVIVLCDRCKTALQKGLKGVDDGSRRA